jgi:hypothetical protein
MPSVILVGNKTDLLNNPNTLKNKIIDNSKINKFLSKKINWKYI